MNFGQGTEPFQVFDEEKHLGSHHHQHHVRQQQRQQQQQQAPAAPDYDDKENMAPHARHLHLRQAHGAPAPHNPKPFHPSKAYHVPEHNGTHSRRALRELKALVKSDSIEEDTASSGGGGGGEEGAHSAHPPARQAKPRTKKAKAMTALKKKPRSAIKMR